MRGLYGGFEWSVGEVLHTAGGTVDRGDGKTVDIAGPRGQLVEGCLAGCLTAGVASVATNRGVQLRSVRATLAGDMDLAGILGIADWDVGARAVAANEDDGFSFVVKQPENDDEEAQCEEALESCPVEAIGDDGEET